MHLASLVWPSSSLTSRRQRPRWGPARSLTAGKLLTNPFGDLQPNLFREIHVLLLSSVQFSSVTQSCLTLRPHGLQHARPPWPSPTPGVYSNSCPSSWWCHPTISSSVVPFSSRLQSSPASGTFQISQFLPLSFSTSASDQYQHLKEWCCYFVARFQLMDRCPSLPFPPRLGAKQASSTGVSIPSPGMTGFLEHEVLETCSGIWDR